MELKCLDQSCLDNLKVNIENNIQNGNYAKDNPWLDEFFTEEYTFSIGNVKNIKFSIPEEGSGGKERTKYDGENCKVLYEALKGLTIDQATDDRLWTYLTHVTFWDYMKRRWPLTDQTNPIGFINDRYFPKKNNNKSMVRNGVSRLWWMAYSTYDESLENPFEITEFLLKDSDMQVSLMERNYSRNSNFIKKVLRAVKIFGETNFQPNTTLKRKLWVELNRIGGVKVLDMLSYDDVYKIAEYVFTQD